MIVDLIHFLRTGSLGALSIGDSRRKVIEMLGAPHPDTDDSNSLVPTARVYLYHGAQIWFKNDEVECMGIESPVHGEPYAIIWAGVAPPWKVHPNEFKMFLGAHSIATKQLPADPTS